MYEAIKVTKVDASNRWVHVERLRSVKEGQEYDMQFRKVHLMMILVDL